MEVRRTFDNAWILEAFENRPGFFTRRMFGGLAVYLFGRQMMLLVEPTKTGRWKWHGVLICTEHARQPAIIEEFPPLAPHDVLTKWLYIDSRHEDFEPTMTHVAEAMARDDRRFGIEPRQRKERAGASGSESLGSGSPGRRRKRPPSRRPQGSSAGHRGRG
jgi:hypothetical protein